MVLLVPFLPIFGYYLGGGWCHLITPGFVFGLIPLLDLLIPKYQKNPRSEEEKKIKEKLSYRLITWICAPLHLGVVSWGLYVVAVDWQITWWETFLLAISIGISGGVVGINTAHELGHRVNNNFEPFLSRLMLWPNFYMHWIIEHVTGHHRYVSTPQDPATAPLNMNVYRFWFRSVFGGFSRVWKFEKERLKRKKQNPYGFHNRVIVYTIFEILPVILIGIFLPLSSLILYLIQGFVAFSLLEIINYVEHYGLLREKKDGKYEKVKPIHSWNSNQWLTNHFLFQLQRHSDHHFRAGRRYQILRYHEDSLQLPTGYAGMVVLALIPPLWKKIMNPRIPNKMKPQSSHK